MEPSNPRAPRRATLIVGVGFVLLLVALGAWTYSAWTRSWVAAVAKRPELELEVPLRLAEGEISRSTFAPNVGIPHIVYVEVDSGMGDSSDGPCPLSIAWSVRVGDVVVTGGPGEDHPWRTGDRGRGLVRLGDVRTRRGEEHVFKTRIVRATSELGASTARLLVVRNDVFVAETARRAVRVGWLAWIPFGLGIALLTAAWFARRFRIQRRMGSDSAGV